ncbi:MAG: non-hydrolyzing UDP-N-acetylglucosamine 2-epimerase [Algoriphagus aquaeductus]|uniref:non-hydrolyzing UDP-N-acetylglucosamine 2-epimerase n=1 Tax=Algoriphagus aquaeductus TaxID=475299 RepID=UPI00391BAAFD
MIKIVTIIGARPQIIKAAALSREIKVNFSSKIKEIIVHTGQHYDHNMSAVFFDELDIPYPDYNLGIGSGTHGEATGKMIEGIEKILLDLKPDFVVLYGDTNSTLAGAIAASKIHIPIVHIEAGLRSFNKRMPEEINRILCDHSSTLLFAPTENGFNNLLREGFKNTNSPYTIDNPGIFNSGDIMLDNSIYFGEKADNISTVLTELNLSLEGYFLATVHRADNTDGVHNLVQIFNGLHDISLKSNLDVIIPLHPRTKEKISSLSGSLKKTWFNDSKLRIIEPVSFLDMICLEKNSKMIITDSGGVQKEAFFFHRPCIILRNETEWVEIVENGCAILSGANSQKMMLAYDSLKMANNSYPNLFGNGNAAHFICEKIVNLDEH